MTAIQFLRIARNSLIISGAWHFTDLSKPLEIFYKCYSFFVSYYLLSTTLLMFVTQPMLIKDSTKLSENVGFAILYILSWLKVFFIKSSKDMRATLNYIVEKEAKLFAKANNDVKKIFQDYIKLNNIFGYIILIMGAISGISFSAIRMPAIFLYKNSNSTEDYVFSRRPVLFFYIIPFVDIEVHYKFVFVVQCITFACAMSYYYSQLLIFSNLTTYILSRIAILQYYVRNLRSFSEEYARKHSLDLNRASYVFLRKCIEEHNEVINMSEKIQKTIKFVVWLEFAGSSFQIAMLLLEIKEVKNIIIVAYASFYLILNFTNFVLFCWRANEIQVQSVRIADLLFYETDWFECNKAFNKLLLTFMQRAQRPLYISNGPFGTLSLESFLKVIKASFSYLTFFESLKE